MVLSDIGLCPVSHRSRPGLIVSTYRGNTLVDSTVAHVACYLTSTNCQRFLLWLSRLPHSSFSPPTKKARCQVSLSRAPQTTYQSRADTVSSWAGGWWTAAEVCGRTPAWLTQIRCNLTIRQQFPSLLGVASRDTECNMERTAYAQQNWWGLPSSSSSSSSSDRVDSEGPLRQHRVTTTSSFGPFVTTAEGRTVDDLLYPRVALTTRAPAPAGVEGRTCRSL